MSDKMDLWAEQQRGEPRRQGAVYALRDADQLKMDALPPLRVSDLRDLVEKARNWEVTGKAAEADPTLRKRDAFVDAEEALSALLARMGLGAQQP